LRLYIQINKYCTDMLTSVELTFDAFSHSLTEILYGLRDQLILSFWARPVTIVNYQNKILERMVKQILIMDKDSSTLNDISRMVTAMNYEPMVIFNLSSSQQNIIRDNIAAIFLDVETKMIKAAEVIQYFNSPQKIDTNNEIPVFLLYTNPGSKFVAEAKTLPHTGILKKPITLEALFKLLDENLDLDNIKYEQFTNEYKLNKFKEYVDASEIWLGKFGALLNN